MNRGIAVGAFRMRWERRRVRSGILHSNVPRFEVDPRPGDGSNATSWSPLRKSNGFSLFPR
jgi:hypothetical protein